MEGVQDMGISTEVGRLVSRAGAAFGLMPVLDHRRPPAEPDSTLLVDVEILTPDRFVSYLGRKVRPSSLRRLADSYMRAAAERVPEVSVPSIEIPEAGVVVSYVGSTDLEVALQVSVTEELGADMPEHDVVGFEVSRGWLIAASHQLTSWFADLHKTPEDDA